MLQMTVKRAADIPGTRPPLLICNDAHRFIVKEQLNEINCSVAEIILEPAGRNTAPAIALAALKLLEVDSEAILLVMPADHIIGDQQNFSASVMQAVNAAKKGYLVTFGIIPSAPETGYGYIKLGKPIYSEPPHTISDIYEVNGFIEKPDLTTAQRLILEGSYVWNSGMFVFRANRYLEELEKYRPQVLEMARRSWAGKTYDIGFYRPEEESFLSCQSESIDYAVMQNTRTAAVIPSQFSWSDVGSWASLWETSNKDESGNVIQGDTFVNGTSNSYVRSEHRHVAVIGMDNVVVVETPDAVLVMHRDKAQEIKKVINFFNENGRNEHIEHIKIHRPWGWYEGIDKGERFQVKRIMVKPGEKLSLQMHHHRAEHWIVVSGTARVTNADREILLSENQSTYIPLGQTHRLENPGKIDLHLIEVQSGSYLGEDDIIRFADGYGRTRNAKHQ